MSSRLPRLLGGAAILTALSLVPAPVLAAPQTPAAPTASSGPAATDQSAAAAATSDYRPKAPKWGTCTLPRLQQVGAQCAKIEVPLDYRKPKGTKIKLAVSRLKHTTKKSQGIMLVNPGGPGGSGLIYSIFRDFIPKQAGQGYDWIGFDPRGVGDSEPAVRCDPQFAGYNRPRYVPATPALSEAWFAKTNAYTRACDDKNGKILNHLTTIDSAKDMDSIRAALGQKKINYYGFSYGTYLGQVYGTLYPKRLRRVVFDGTVDPRGVWYKANLSQDVAFDRNINIWFRWLSEHNDVYGLGNTGSAVRSLFYQTMERLYADPVQASGGKLGGSEWTDAFLYAGYYQSTWTDLAQVFSGFVKNNDVKALEGAYLDASGYGDDNGYAVYLGVQCTDTRWPRSWKRWERDNWRIFARAPYETWSNAWFNEPCRHWPARAQKPVKVTGKGVKSILMINETLDAATPFPGSIEVRRRFRGARLIAVDGGTTHSNSLAGNACVDNKIADYLATGKLPKRKSGQRADVTCQPMPQPDPTPASSSSRKAQTKEQAKSADQVPSLVKERQKAAVRP